MDIQNELYQKNAIVISQLAKVLIVKTIGDKLPTFADFSDRFKVGRGTVQTAMKRLIDMDAVKTSNRGHMGTIITFLDFNLLLKISGLRNVVGVMPLPYSKRYEGLATAIYDILNKPDINVHLAFMTGSHNRLKTLIDERYDFMIISKLTADLYLEELQPIDIVTVLPEGSYVKHHVMLVREDISKIEDGMKIGIDLSSSDQNFITMQYFSGKNIQLIPVQYSNIIDSIKNNMIDGAIWSTDNLDISKSGIKVYETLSSNSKKEATQATLVVKKGNTNVKAFLQRFIDSDAIMKIQSDVMKGVSVPNY